MDGLMLTDIDVLVGFFEMLAAVLVDAAVQQPVRTARLKPMMVTKTEAADLA